MVNTGNFVSNFAYSGAYSGGSSLLANGGGNAGGLAGLNALLSANEAGTKRERTKFNEQQLRHLEKMFERCQYPQGMQREQMAACLRLTETKIQVWFKNRRAKERANKKYEELRQQSLAATSSSSSASSHHSFMSAGSCKSVFSGNSGGSLPGKMDRGRHVKSEGTTAPQDENTGCSGSASSGGTEDENEGSRQAMGDKKESPSTRNLSSLPITTHHFPTSMPMIPLPSTLLDFDVGKLEPTPPLGFATSTTASNSSLQHPLQPGGWDYGTGGLSTSLMSVRNGWTGGVSGVATSTGGTDFVSPFTSFHAGGANSNWMTNPASVFNMTQPPFPPTYPIAAAAAAANYYSHQNYHNPSRSQAPQSSVAAAAAAAVTASAYDLYNYQQAAAAACYAHPSIGFGMVRDGINCLVKDSATTGADSNTAAGIDSKI